jgi:hypothetical protein
MDNPSLDQTTEAKAEVLAEKYETVFPLLHRALSLTLLTRAFEASQQAEVPTETLSFWHKLLVENSKLAAPAAGSPTGPVPDILEMTWDIFGVPEEERVRRRAVISQKGGAN